MRKIKLALLVAGVAFGMSANANTEQVDESVISDDAAILLFNEGDGPDAMEEGPDAARTYVRCQSHGYGMNRCRVPGRIQSVRLVRRLSFAPCIAGRTFGATPRYVWVRNGCSGQFLVRYRHGGGGGGWGDDDDGWNSEQR